MKSKTIIVKECYDCPVSIQNDMDMGYSCWLDKGKMIKPSATYKPITPTWCPLKKYSISFEWQKIIK